MEMIVVDAVAGSLAGWTRSYTVIYTVKFGIFEGEVVPIADDGPRGIVAGDVVHGHLIRHMPVNAVDGVGRCHVGCGCADIKILDGQGLHPAAVAPQRINGHGVLLIGAAGTVRRVLNNAVDTAVERDMAAALEVNRAQA